jgi:hypothetical protein
MKTIILATILVTLSISCRSQGVFSNSTNTAIEKVIQDYPNGFRNIKGSVVTEKGIASNFESIIQIPGSISCVVSEKTAGDRPAMSWKADLCYTSDFTEASRKYTELFNLIKNSIIKLQGTKPYILSGQYTEPNKNKLYHAIVLRMLPASGDLQSVKVEISLEQIASSWKLQLTIYDDKDEQWVRGG